MCMGPLFFLTIIVLLLIPHVELLALGLLFNPLSSDGGIQILHTFVVDRPLNEIAEKLNVDIHVRAEWVKLR